MAIYTNNKDNPNSPEYGKGWKPEHNAGCCPSCNIDTPVSDCTTVVQRFTRGDQSADLISEKDCGCPAPITTGEPCPGETGC